MEQFKTTKELRDYARRDRGATEEYVPKKITEDTKVEDVIEATKEVAKDTPKKKGVKKGEAE